VPQQVKRLIETSDPGPCQFPTLGFVVDQYERVQAFVPETFWYIHIEQQRPEGAIKFNWRRNHLFDMAAAFILYEQCVEEPEATVTSVTTKPTTKWYVVQPASQELY
jgi:DNA topoisomerase-3